MWHCYLWASWRHWCAQSSMQKAAQLYFVALCHDEPGSMHEMQAWMKCTMFGLNPFLLQGWKHKVLPHLYKHLAKKVDSAMSYMLVYHEVTVANLLEVRVLHVCIHISNIMLPLSSSEIAGTLLTTAHVWHGVLVCIMLVNTKLGNSSYGTVMRSSYKSFSNVWVLHSNHKQSCWHVDIK